MKANAPFNKLPSSLSLEFMALFVQQVESQSRAI